MTIYDRDRTIVGQWMTRTGSAALTGRDSGTFSLPQVYNCPHPGPGPFWAFAAVGGYSARLRGLPLDHIACLRGAKG